MIRSLKIWLGACALAAILAGCGSGGASTASTTTGGSGSGNSAPAADPMVGTWKLVMTPESLKKMPKDMKAPDMTFEFKADKTFDANLVLGTVNSKATGEYKVDGKKLTLTFKTEDGKPATTPPATVDLAADGKSFPMPGGPPGEPAPGNIVKQ